MIKDIENFLKEKKIYPSSLNEWLIFFSIASILTLITGFIIWNIYLYFLGFVEDEIIQSRFILTGITFWLITAIIVWIIKKLFLLNLLFLKIKSKIWSAYLTLFLWTIFYCLIIFPIIPLFLGGGQPKSLAIIADINDMNIIKSFSIGQPDNGQYQTDNLCVAYESNKDLIILREYRILGIDKLNIKGVISLPGIKQVNENSCINLYYGWAWQGAYSSIFLFVKQIYKWLVLLFLVIKWWGILLLAILIIVLSMFKKIKARFFMNKK